MHWYSPHSENLPNKTMNLYIDFRIFRVMCSKKLMCVFLNCQLFSCLPEELFSKLKSPSLESQSLYLNPNTEITTDFNPIFYFIFEI